MPEQASEEQRASATPATTQTQTQTQTQTRTQDSPRVLRLRGGHISTGRSVQWAEDVIDNEGLGKKSSKVCCIYHRPKAVDESSDESTSSSSSSSSSDSDPGSEPESRRDAKKKKKDPACGHSCGKGGRGGDKKRARTPSPNAYEKVPRQKSKGLQ